MQRVAQHLLHHCRFGLGQGRSELFATRSPVDGGRSINASRPHIASCCAVVASTSS
jgi:hypothetical protein